MIFSENQSSFTISWILKSQINVKVKSQTSVWQTPQLHKISPFPTLLRQPLEQSLFKLLKALIVHNRRLVAVRIRALFYELKFCNFAIYG